MPDPKIVDLLNKAGLTREVLGTRALIVKLLALAHSSLDRAQGFDDREVGLRECKAALECLHAMGELTNICDGWYMDGIDRVVKEESR